MRRRQAMLPRCQDAGATAGVPSTVAVPAQSLHPTSARRAAPCELAHIALCRRRSYNGSGAARAARESSCTPVEAA